MKKNIVFAILYLLTAGKIYAVDFSEVFQLENKSSKEYLQMALRAAAKEDDASLINSILEINGVDINERGQHGASALQIAAMSGSNAAIKALLDKKAHIDSEMNASALVIAIGLGRLSTVKLLLERGAAVNQPQIFDMTTLDMIDLFNYDSCEASLEDKTAIAHLLVEYGAKTEFFHTKAILEKLGVSYPPVEESAETQP